MLAYKTNPLQGLADRIGWFDRTGRVVEEIGPFPFQSFGGVALSPDGKQLAMQSPSGLAADSDIWLFDLTGRRPAQFTFSDGPDRAPVWSPDGQRVVFASQRPDGPGMYLKGVGGERPEELLLRSTARDWEEHWPTDWSTQGILFVRGQTRDRQDIWMLPVDGDRRPYPVVQEPGLETEPEASHDGKWLAYASRERPTSRGDIYIRSLSSPGGKWRVSTAGGRWPHWRADGKELFYLAPDGNLMSVPVTFTATKPSFGVQKPLMRVSGGVTGAGTPRFFGVSPDGQRFLLTVTDHWPTTASIVVVTNWPVLLKRP